MGFQWWSSWSDFGAGIWDFMIEFWALGMIDGWIYALLWGLNNLLWSYYSYDLANKNNADIAQVNTIGKLTISISGCPELGNRCQHLPRKLIMRCRTTAFPYIQKDPRRSESFETSLSQWFHWPSDLRDLSIPPKSQPYDVMPGDNDVAHDVIHQSFLELLNWDAASSVLAELAELEQKVGDSMEMFLRISGRCSLELYSQEMVRQHEDLIGK